MKIHLNGVPILTIQLDTIIAFTELQRVDIITPSALTVAMFKTVIVNFADSDRLKHSVE